MREVWNALFVVYLQLMNGFKRKRNRFSNEIILITFIKKIIESPALFYFHLMHKFCSVFCSLNKSILMRTLLSNSEWQIISTNGKAGKFLHRCITTTTKKNFSGKNYFKLNTFNEFFIDEKGVKFSLLNSQKLMMVILIWISLIISLNLFFFCFKISFENSIVDHSIDYEICFFSSVWRSAECAIRWQWDLK